jgi:hypothetical protein
MSTRGALDHFIVSRGSWVSHMETDGTAHTARQTVQFHRNNTATRETRTNLLSRRWRRTRRASKKKYDFTPSRAPRLLDGGGGVQWMRWEGRLGMDFRPQAKLAELTRRLPIYKFSARCRNTYCYSHPLSYCRRLVYGNDSLASADATKWRQSGGTLRHTVYRCVRRKIWRLHLLVVGRSPSWWERKGGKKRDSTAWDRERKRSGIPKANGGGVTWEQTHQLEEPLLVTWPVGQPQQGVCISRKVARALSSQNTWTVQVTINTGEAPLLANLSFLYGTHTTHRAENAFMELLPSRLSLPWGWNCLFTWECNRIKGFHVYFDAWVSPLYLAVGNKNKFI